MILRLGKITNLNLSMQPENALVRVKFWGMASKGNLLSPENSAISNSSTL
jgi:hypothetical protein